MYMFNWLKKIINPNISGGVDGFPRFLTSCSPSITTPTIKREYKLEPWGGGKTYQRNASLCWNFHYSPASPLFPLLLRLSFPSENPCFQDLCSPYLVRKKSIASLDLLEHKALEVVLVISGLGWRNLEPSFRTVPQWLQVVTNFYVVINKISLILIHFYLLIHVLMRLFMSCFESIMQIEMIMSS
jgi:hypothetical protein